MKENLKTLLWAAAAALCVLGIILANATTMPNAGNIAGTLLFGALFAAVVFRKRLGALVRRLWERKLPRALLCVFAGIAALGAAVCLFFSVCMLRFGTENCTQTDCVIVLGCQVRGETPGNMLLRRLNKALEVLESSPNAVCVVSGGQGKGEDISEAEAMKLWLAQRGISEERILCEDRATSTEENLRFSAEVIAENGISGNITVVTSEFHQFRAHIYAKRAGLSASHASAPTGSSVVNCWLREWLALAAAFI